MTRRGDWFQTYTGIPFYPVDPRPDEINGEDIAHALSMICRFGGHSRWFYSVAEHCVLMSHAVSPENALWALLHDATEAYVGDMVRPLKRQLPSYMEVEDGIAGLICYRFGLDYDCPAEVKAADNRILVAEAAALMSECALPWSLLDGVEPLPVEIVGWTPSVAEYRYRTRLAELTEV